uniref:UTP--glucose-1-phosphate uridylyltransferase n=1 Tax=Glossina pallidipes TaxID=7398 RepID=A0A1A9Z124_GLOPL
MTIKKISTVIIPAAGLGTLKNRPFAVILPDIIINEYTSNLKKDNLSAMLKRFQNTGRSQILVKKVRNVQNYGVPGNNDEFQLTDAIDMLIQDETVEAYLIKGLSHDCGNKLGYMQAFVQYGLRHKNFGKIFKKWIQSIIYKNRSNK